MKKMTKILCAVLALVLAVGASIGGTLAWLTSKTAKVENVFTVGKVNITLDEARVNLYGEPVDAQDQVVELDKAPRQLANSYKMLPGQTYTKDPTVHVTAGSEDCYLYVHLYNGLTDERRPSNTVEDPTKETIAQQMARLGWTLLPGTRNLYVYKDIVNSGDYKVFEQIHIDGNADEAKLNGFNEQTIELIAYAVQADHMADASDAWAKSGFAATK